MSPFIKDLLERALKTAAQTAIALIGVAQVVSGVDWTAVADGTGLAVILSVLTSLLSYNFGDQGTASLVSTEQKRGPDGRFVAGD